MQTLSSHEQDFCILQVQIHMEYKKRKLGQGNILKQIPSSFKQDILFQAILHLFHSQPIDTLIYYGKLGNSKKIDINISITTIE